MQGKIWLRQSHEGREEGGWSVLREVKHKYHAQRLERVQGPCDSFCTLTKGVIVGVPFREIENEKSSVLCEVRMIKDERDIGIEWVRADRMADLSAGGIGTSYPRCGEGREESRVGS